jgi:selenocysteine-specific elongation factor
VVVSFIDVPGHERFVRNMLAGAHGIDAVALVVAADESVMPQTREHFEICRLLGIPRGLVVLTKCDVADAESQALAELEVRELVFGSFLEGRPLLRISARTGLGLEGLVAALLALAHEVPSRSADGLLRLPIDRVFTLRGFGTVVTGTLISGELRVGEELEVLPSGHRARVRGLQIHGEAVEVAPAGSRSAVNLAGVLVSDLARGDVLARPGTVRPTSMIDVEVELLAGAKPLLDQTRVRVHVASAEVLARVRLLEGGRLAPGESGLAQLRLERPAVAGRGDRLVLRSYSPAFTIGGALVLDPLPRRRNRADGKGSARLRARGRAPFSEAAASFVAEAGAVGIDAATLSARLCVSTSALRLALAPPSSVVALGPGPSAYISEEALATLARSAKEVLARFHRENPLRPAMPREEMRRRIFAHAPEGAFDRVLQDLLRTVEIRVEADTLALARHEVTLGPEEQQAQRALLEASMSGGLAGIDVPGLAARLGIERRLLERLAHLLLAEGRLFRVGDAMLVHRDHLDSLKARVRERWPPGSSLDVPGFKELTGLTRKHVIPLLEYLDRERVTRRLGNDRTVI